MRNGWHLFSAFVVCGTLIADEVIDPFAEPDSAPPEIKIPERGIEKLPKSIHHKTLDDGRHEYTIDGVYPLDEDDEPEDFEDYCSGFFKPSADAEAKLDGRVLTLTTSEEISYDWLAWAIDTIAGGSGDIPTWVEFEARDLVQSPRYDQGLYQVEKIDGDFPPGLAWLGLPHDSDLRFPFFTCLWDLKSGAILISPTTALCMCHSRFSIRILDENNQVIWKKEDPARGDVRVAIGDIDGDRVHELYFETFDHGTETRYAIKQRSEQDAAEQPATAGESK